eukprot:6460221-Amphidinium_carterae.1
MLVPEISASAESHKQRVRKLHTVPVLVGHARLTQNSPAPKSIVTDPLDSDRALGKTLLSGAHSSFTHHGLGVEATSDNTHN